MKRLNLFLLFIILIFSVCSTAQRLPDVAVPDNYRLTLTPDFNRDNFVGEETIQIRLLKPASSIVLNSLDINFQEATIASGGVAQAARVTVDQQKQMATLSVPKQLSAGPASVRIRYSGVLNNELRGFYLGKAGGRKYAATQFESTDARRAFPSFDEPAYKATFDITAVVDEGDVAISNYPVASDQPGPVAGKHSISFKTTPKMSSYLVALVVGNFEYVEGSADGVPIRVWTTPGKKQMGNYALQVGEQCVKYFDNYFGIKYPFEKLDLIGLPDFAAGAMENTGAITFRDALLLVDDKNAPTYAYKEIGSVISHEIAHQWFGDLVTMQWWDDIWLNEGFATWMENKPLEAWKPEWHMELDDVLGSGNSLNIDSLQNTRPIHQAADTPDQIEELFDGIAYGKAASVLRMLESYLGPEAFRDGVRSYIAAHSYGNATENDFWSALAKASNKPVDRMMPTFVNQPGAPLVSIQAQCQGGVTKVMLSQRRYSYDRRPLDSESKELWMVPVALKTAGQKKDATVLLEKPDQVYELPGCYKWMFGNAGAQGYYRVGYDSADFQTMSRNVKQEFSPAERIVLIRDAWAAVRTGQQPIGDFLRLAEGLQSERNAKVVEQMDLELEYIGDRLVSDADRVGYEAFVRALLGPIQKELGWTVAPGEDTNRKDLRAYVTYTLGYTGREPEVLAKARELTLQEMNAPGSVDPSLVDAVFGLAALQGDVALYDKMMSHIKENQAPEQYYRYFYNLARFTHPALLQRTLDYAFSPAVRSQDSLNLIASVMDTPAGEKLAWNFVRSHWDQIQKIMGGYNTGGLVSTTGSFCDTGMRDQVKQFFVEHPVPAAERSLRQAQEQVNYCIDLRVQQSPALAAWLERNGASSGK
jgi:puromycin-sensitive aminopeptidase